MNLVVTILLVLLAMSSVVYLLQAFCVLRQTRRQPPAIASGEPVSIL